MLDPLCVSILVKRMMVVGVEKKVKSNLAIATPLRPLLHPRPSSHVQTTAVPRYYAIRHCRRSKYPRTRHTRIETLGWVVRLLIRSSFTRRDLLISNATRFRRTRKEIKIRPGFTPQEDVGRFRGTKQQEMDSRVLPKGHIIGWVAPSSVTNNTAGKSSGTMSKSQKKNEKRKEKKKADIAKKIQENWEDDDEDEIKPASKPKATTEDSNKTDSTADEVAEKLEKLEVNN